MTILMLQAFTVKRGAPGSGAQQEAPRLRIPRRPGQVAHALKAEHGVIDVERNQGEVMDAVTGGAASQPDMAPASLMPSSRMRPFLSSR